MLGVMAGRGYLPAGIKSFMGLDTEASKDQDVAGSGDKGLDSDIIKTLEKDPKFVYYDELITKKKEAAQRSCLDTEQKKERETPPKKIKPIKPIKKDGLYTLQVASLDSEINALKMVNRLKTGGFKAYYTKVNLKGKAHYRVRCGKFENWKEAMGLKKILAQREGILSSYIAKVTE